MNDERTKALIQINAIISVLPEDKKKNIPSDIMNEIKNAKLDKYLFKYDYSKSILKQDISEEAKEMLFSIYINYIATKEELAIINKKIKITTAIII